MECLIQSFSGFIHRIYTGDGALGQQAINEEMSENQLH